MNRDLEALLMAFDALLQAGADDADRLEAIFEQQLEDTLAHYPNLTKGGLCEQCKPITLGGSVHSSIHPRCRRELNFGSSPPSLPHLALDQAPVLDDNIPADTGAYWFRLGRYARGGMPRMVRWPR